jgi:hypothetical protein
MEETGEGGDFGEMELEDTKKMAKCCIFTRFSQV